jgi:hypothetical protein
LFNIPSCITMKKKRVKRWNDGPSAKISILWHLFIGLFLCWHWTWQENSDNWLTNIYILKFEGHSTFCHLHGMERWCYNCANIIYTV